MLLMMSSFEISAISRGFLETSRLSATPYQGFIWGGGGHLRIATIHSLYVYVNIEKALSFITRKAD